MIQIGSINNQPTTEPKSKAIPVEMLKLTPGVLPVTRKNPKRFKEL